MHTILLVGSRKTSMDSLREIIAQQGYDCVTASNKRVARRLVHQRAPDLIIIDHTSFRLSANKLSDSFRRLSDVPIIAIVRTKEQASEAEAMDHLVRPYSNRQLLSSIRRTLRRYPLELQAGPVRLNLRTRRIRVPHRADEPRLRPKLFALLRHLMLHKGKVVSRAALMANVWNTTFIADTRTLDVHVRWIRELIEPNPSRPIYLLTERGKGYRLVNGKG